MKIWDMTIVLTGKTQSHTGTALANAFEGVLNNFGITDKVDNINL